MALIDLTPAGNEWHEDVSSSSRADVALNLHCRDIGTPAIFLDSDLSGSDPLIKTRATDAQDAGGLDNIETYLRELLG
jgi:hypothetical protein